VVLKKFSIVPNEEGSDTTNDEKRYNVGEKI
jgi:hypothetical protein